MQRIKSLFTAEGLKALQESRSFMRALKLLQGVFMLAVIGFLGYRLSEIGWHEVWAALPTTPWFYVILLVMYFIFPAFEILVYQSMWDAPLWRHFSIFVRKRVYNFAVLSYTGEAYLAFWARKRLPLSTKRIFATVKDSNILSALASNSFTVILLAVFFLTGELSVITKASPDYKMYLVLAVLVGAILVPVVVKFREHIISLEPQVARRVFLIHLVRLVVMLLLQTAQWAVVLPSVPFSAWLMFLTAQLVLTRVPFLPNTDLLLAGLGLTLMGYLDAPEAVVAGMFLAGGALSQLLNAIAFVGTSMHDLKRVPLDTAEDQPDDDMATETA
ncbi:hypothetical protein [Kordiimonas marina]|uniref:hypothetical protein n=1 Tax=Kordiimonas marina TaxID=2872312 RepID=UPI001FF2BFAA|nr:hypothetical protein [Kordiimonas marina]MCJ9430577.1 hypothetical protein [Kordiimonas marina]